jgi:hypothetical protein
MKKFAVCGLLLVILLSVCQISLAATPTMSWDFLIFHNPNARQVALNIAIKQREVFLEQNEKTALERFKESLERQVINTAIREIVEAVFDPNGEIQEGWYQVGEDIISFERNEDGNMVVTYIDANGNLTEIILIRNLEYYF